MLFPGQVNTYIADSKLPWEYTWVEFDGLRAREIVTTAGLSLNHPVYHASSKELRNQMMEEMLYLSRHPEESPFHLIGHLYLFLDYFMRSAATVHVKQNGSIRDFYIKEALSYIEQNFQNDISVEDISAFCGLNRSYFGKIFHDTIGRSPQEFLISYRMTKAAELFEDHFTVNCRYWECRRVSESVLHFHKCIQKCLVGSSPRNWRIENKIE